MQLNTHTFLNGATAASASGLFFTDYRFNDIPERTIMGTLTSGAEVRVLAYVDPVNFLVAHTVSTVSASSFSLVVAGPVAAIKVEKVGASGTATVQGLV